MNIIKFSPRLYIWEDRYYDNLRFLVGCWKWATGQGDIDFHMNWAYLLVTHEKNKEKQKPGWKKGTKRAWNKGPAAKEGE